MKPLEITDPQLAARVQRIVEQLEEYYPDHVIRRGIQNDHKKLSERIGKARKECGYESLGDFLEAYGFSQAYDEKGGRAAETEYAATDVFIELRKRYDGKDLPATVSILVEQNPDLAGKLKTLTNRSREIFGTTFANVLREEGLLSKTGGSKRNSIRNSSTREQTEDALEELALLYENGREHPRGIAQLKKLHPEYRAELEKFELESRTWYNETPVEHLRQLGILAKPKKHEGKADIEGILELLKLRYASLPNEKKPSSFKAICENDPDRAADFKATQTSWNLTHPQQTFVQMLREEGILKLTQERLRMQRKERAACMVRNAKLADLLDVWRKTSSPEVVARNVSTGIIFPAQIAGIDFERKLELRETVVCRIFDEELIGQETLPMLKPGMVCNWEIDNEWRVRISAGELLVDAGLVDADMEATWDDVRFAFDALDGRKQESPLANMETCVIDAVSSATVTSQKYVCVQFRLRYVAPLSEKTMLALLYRNGLLNEADMSGGDGWCSRECTVDFSQVEEARDGGALELIEPKGEDGIHIELTEQSNNQDAEQQEPAFEDDREGKIALLRLFVTANELGSNMSFPQELLDQLDRAEAGDKSVDVDRLAEQLNNVAPNSHTEDAKSLSFEKESIACGRRFLVQIPDGWHVWEDVPDTFGMQRPFVAAPSDVPEKDIPLSDRIIYSSLAGDLDGDASYMEHGTPAFHRWINFTASYGQYGDGEENALLSALSAKNVWDCEVQAKNTSCFVSQHAIDEFPSRVEFNIRPYANDHHDMLRVLLTVENNEDLYAARAAAVRIAESIELDMPKKSHVEQVLEKGMRERISVDDFRLCAVTVVCVFEGMRQTVFNAAVVKYYNIHGEDADELDAVLAGAQELADLATRAVPNLQQLMDIYCQQFDAGASHDYLAEACEYIVMTFDQVIPTPGMFDDRTVRKAVIKAGIFDNLSGMKAAQQRFALLADNLNALPREMLQLPAASVAYAISSVPRNLACAVSQVPRNLVQVISRVVEQKERAAEVSAASRNNAKPEKQAAAKADCASSEREASSIAHERWQAAMTEVDELEKAYEKMEHFYSDYDAWRIRIAKSKHRREDVQKEIKNLGIFAFKKKKAKEAELLGVDDEIAQLQERLKECEKQVIRANALREKLKKARERADALKPF